MLTEKSLYVSESALSKGEVYLLWRDCMRMGGSVQLSKRKTI